jgi:hypothetical protein
MVVTQLIPESRGGATNQCQQPAKWVKSFVVALVILALLGLGDSPARFAHQTSETAVLATGDRFEVRAAAVNCLEKIWPAIPAPCLQRSTGGKIDVARLVAFRR